MDTPAGTDKQEPLLTIGNILAILGTLLSFAYLFAITFCYVSKENIQFAQIGEGLVLGSVLGVVFGYQFGSSKDKKTVVPPAATGSQAAIDSGTGPSATASQA